MVSENPTGSLFTTIENKIATLSFGHPSSNSFPRELLDRLTNEFAVLSSNPAVSVIVIQSIVMVLRTFFIFCGVF